MARIESICVCGRIRSDCDCSTPSAQEKFWRGTPADRGYDQAWRRTSAEYRRQNPLCEDCLENGRTTPAADVHHITPIRVDSSLRLDWRNLRALCRPCHAIADDLLRKQEKNR